MRTAPESGRDASALTKKAWLRGQSLNVNEFSHTMMSKEFQFKIMHNDLKQFVAANVVLRN